MPPSPASTRPSRWPHPLVAAALSAVIPGLGQIAAGHRRRGWWYIAITAALVVPALVLFMMVFYVTGLELAIDLSRPFFRNPGLLLVLLAANAAALAFRVAAAVDAYQLASLGRPISFAGTAIGSALLTLVLLFTAVPHIWIGERNLVLYDALTFDYSQDPGQVTTTPTTATTTFPGTAVTTTVPVGPTTTTLAPTTTTTQPDPFADGERINILLLGSDAGVGRTGVRTDTMIVISVDPETGWTAMFSVPRNFIKLPIPEDHPAHSLWADGAWGDASNLAWAIYAYGLANPHLFTGPNTGGDAAKVVLGGLLGLEVDYFALVHLDGFVAIVDALGGVELNVTTRIYDPEYTHPGLGPYPVDFAPGTYVMDGIDALAFARSRVQTDDFNRMGRQRCILEALARQSEPVELLRELPTLVPAIQQSVITDIPISLIPDFLDLLSIADLENIVSIRLMPNAPEFAGTATSYVAYQLSGYNAPNVPLIRERVQTAITLSPAEAIIALNLQPLADQCGTAAAG